MRSYFNKLAIITPVRTQNTSTTRKEVSRGRPNAYTPLIFWIKGPENAPFLIQADPGSKQASRPGMSGTFFGWAGIRDNKLGQSPGSRFLFPSLNNHVSTGGPPHNCCSGQGRYGCVAGIPFAQFIKTTWK